MLCDVCKKKKSKRVIANIQMCDGCFHQLSLLRNKYREAVDFFSDTRNMKNATPEAKRYIEDILLGIKSDIDVGQAKDYISQVQQEHDKVMERKKVNYAKSFNEYYEYDVVVIKNDAVGTVQAEKLKEILAQYSANGWKLHSIYSNEIGKNRAFVVNSTISEDVLIFERRVESI